MAKKTLGDLASKVTGHPLLSPAGTKKHSVSLLTYSATAQAVAAGIGFPVVAAGAAIGVGTYGGYHLYKYYYTPVEKPYQAKR